ncbi:hypothetical protein PAXRUDRAFT_12733 [Paxillus rubicundulus Ve08.2h10]|uniref:Uncharacterized protein n=1 Tax=Paxillus rubicundulus Ve08.2h10 TaxID=930991 RepID=A0A0D0DV78_9AGAM|nr:hypothetical protein PAXRUDRAFT_12733 [Paxillus rubicundulus Ve08.2h10]
MAVLNSMYCDHLSGQLAAQEEKQKKQKKGRLNGDGLPRLLTGEEFYTRVVEHEEATEQEKIDWKEGDNARKQRNKEWKVAYQDTLQLWEEERNLAKQDKWQIAWAKPKLGKLEAPAPKPVANPGNTDNTGDGAEGDDGNEEGGDDGTMSDGGSEDEQWRTK